MDTAPILHNGNTTYAPIRAIAEEFGLSVDWAVEPKPQSDIIIPDLTKGSIEMDFLNKLIDKVGNGKLDYYTFPLGVVTAMSRVEDGIYHTYSVNVDRVGYSYNAVSVVTVDGAPADEIEAFYRAFSEALLANDYNLLKQMKMGFLIM